MKFTFRNYTYEPVELQELYEQDSSYFSLIEFVRKWRKGDHTFEFQTSGSTGTPKTIPIYRKQIEASVANTAQYLDLQRGEKILLCLHPGYIAAIMMAARGLILDLDVHIISPSINPFEETGDQTFDFASFVPLQIYHMIESGSLDQLSGIRNVLIGGAPLSDDAFQKLAELPNNIYQTYGMTETVSHIGLMPIKGNVDEARFQVLPNLFIGTNEDNCLWIDGDITNNQRIQTTDVVDLKEHQFFKWLGRKDNVINSGGVKIHPEQLEKFMAIEFQKLGFKNSFYISGQKDSKLGEKVMLVIEGDKQDDEVLKPVLSKIEQAFGKYKVPKKVKYLKNFKRTDSGKVIRK